MREKPKPKRKKKGKQQTVGFVVCFVVWFKEKEWRGEKKGKKGV